MGGYMEMIRIYEWDKSQGYIYRDFNRHELIFLEYSRHRKEEIDMKLQKCQSTYSNILAPKPSRNEPDDAHDQLTP